MKSCNDTCELYPMGEYCIECKHYWTPIDWGRDAMKGMAASGMGFDKKKKKKHGFQSTTSLGEFIDDCVKSSMEEHGLKYKG